MNALDKILYKRLERIREELDEYIDSRFRARMFSSPIMSKFLNVMRLHDEDEEDYFEDEFLDNDEEKMSSPEPFVTAGKESDKTYLALDEVLGYKRESFSKMLLRIIDEKGFRDTDVYKWANVDRRLFSKIRADKGYVPSKKTAISFCLALQLELDEAKKLLERAGYALSPSSRFDLIIMYLIENKEYNIQFANIVLENYGEGTLSK